MQTIQHKQLNEPDTSLVLFFRKGQKIFPVVVPDMSLSQIKAETERLERQINAKYLSRLKTVADWNDLVEQGKDPCNVVLSSLLSEQSKQG